jgi:hypothetical protein
MRAFICEVDQHGLRRLLPEDVLSFEELGHLARHPTLRPIAVIRALLEESDAEDLAEFCPAEVGPAKVDIVEDRPTEVGIDEVELRREILEESSVPLADAVWSAAQ